VNADAIRLRDLFGHMAEAIRRLRELGQQPTDAFLADYRNTAAARYFLLVATEAAIDVCNHLVARGGGRAPQSYADCFGILAELGHVDAELAGRVQQMARFRNLIVHLYSRVDDREVYRVIHENLGDLELFREQVLKAVSRDEDG